MSTSFQSVSTQPVRKLIQDNNQWQKSRSPTFVLCMTFPALVDTRSAFSIRSLSSGKCIAENE